MFSTAYNTLACRSYDISEIEKAIKLALINDDGVRINYSETGSKQTVDVTPSNTTVPMFAHPLKVTMGTPAEPLVWYAVDTRPFSTLTQGSYKITNPKEASFAHLRATLNQVWDANATDLMSVGDLVPLVFARWLAGAINAKLGLTPEEQVKLNVITVYYWYSLFRTTDFDEREKLRIVSKVSSVTYVPATEAIKIINQLPLIADIQHYCVVVKDIVNSPRLEKLNAALLFAMLGGSWFGINAKELIAVATEHPPTFIAIISMAISSRDYKRTQIGALVLENDKRGRGEDFTKAITSIVKMAH